MSLGIDVLGTKICSMNCVYCEVRKTELLTDTRKPYVTASEVIEELDAYFEENPNPSLNYITFAGKGEPTLNSEISLIIKHIKEHYPYPVCILTNGSLLYKEDVRKDLMQADLIVPSLDAISDKAFKKINHPHQSITVDKIIDGIKLLRKEFPGELWIEILFVKGINDTPEEILLLKEKIKDIQPDQIYVNTIYRPPSFENYQSIDKSTLNNIQSDMDKLIGTTFLSNQKINSTPVDIQYNVHHNDFVERIKPILSIRPCTLDDLSDIFCTKTSDLKKNDIQSILEELVHKKILDIEEYENSQFYCLNKK